MSAYDDETLRLRHNVEHNSRLLAMVQRIGPFEEETTESIESIYAYDYGEPTIEIKTKGDARALALMIQSRVKQLTGTTEHVQKTFDEQNGLVTYHVSGFKDGNRKVAIRIPGGVPKLCKVTKVMVPVRIEAKPAQEARIEYREKYVIENPEECGAQG